MAVKLEQKIQIVPRHLKITGEEYVPEKQEPEVAARWEPRVEPLFGGDPFIRRAILGI